MSNISQQEILEEQKKYAMKFFDYAETPIQKWLAMYFCIPVKTLFPDFKDDTDLISVEESGNYYILYITEKQLESPCDYSYMENSISIKKAASLLFDAVRNTFFAIVKTMNGHKDVSELLIPIFNDSIMAFELKAFNRLAMEKDQADKELLQISSQMQKLNDMNNVKAENRKQIMQLKTQLSQLQTDCLKKYNSITTDSITKMDNKCEELNKTLFGAPKLYIVLEKNTKPSAEQVAKRLPVFGIQYQDVDEDSYIDTLRKELENKP